MRIVVGDADPLVYGRRKGAREDDHLQTGHGTVPALCDHKLVGLASHHGRVEFLVQRREVDGRVVHDPVILTLWPGDEAVQAYSYLVAQSSAHLSGSDS